MLIDIIRGFFHEGAKDLTFMVGFSDNSREGLSGVMGPYCSGGLS